MYLSALYLRHGGGGSFSKLLYIYMVHSIHIVDDKAPNVFTNVEKKLGSASNVHQKGKNQIPFEPF
jgi:hypothetical protein